jgi:hypothetical protein
MDKKEFENIILSNDINFIKQHISDIEVSQYVDMFIEEDFFIDSLVFFDNVEVVKFFIKSTSINNKNLILQVVYRSIVLNSFSLIEYIVENLNVINTSNIKELLRYAVSHNHTKILKYLLKNPMVVPEEDNNMAAFIAYNAKSFESLDILWDDSRVKTTLNFSEPAIVQHLVQKRIKQNVKEF